MLKTAQKKQTTAHTKTVCAVVFFYNENHQQCWWFQKALALHSPAAAEGSPV